MFNGLAKPAALVRRIQARTDAPSAISTDADASKDTAAPSTPDAPVATKGANAIAAGSGATPEPELSSIPLFRLDIFVTLSSFSLSMPTKCRDYRSTLLLVCWLTVPQTLRDRHRGHAQHRLKRAPGNHRQPNRCQGFARVAATATIAPHY